MKDSLEYLYDLLGAYPSYKEFAADDLKKLIKQALDEKRKQERDLVTVTIIRLSDKQRAILRDQAYVKYKQELINYSSAGFVKGKHNTAGLKAMCAWLKTKGVYSTKTSNCDIVNSIYKEHRKRTISV